MILPVATALRSTMEAASNTLPHVPRAPWRGNGGGSRVLAEQGSRLSTAPVPIWVSSTPFIRLAPSFQHYSQYTHMYRHTQTLHSSVHCGYNTKALQHVYVRMCSFIPRAISTCAGSRYGRDLSRETPWAYSTVPHLSLCRLPSAHQFLFPPSFISGRSVVLHPSMHAPT